MHFKINPKTIKALTWGCTDHFAAGFIYLQYSNQVWFSFILLELFFQFHVFNFSRERSIFYCELWPMILTYKLKVDRIKKNRYAYWPKAISFDSNRENTRTHTDCSKWTTKWTVRGLIIIFGRLQKIISLFCLHVCRLNLSNLWG